MLPDSWGKVAPSLELDNLDKFSFFACWRPRTSSTNRCSNTCGHSLGCTARKVA